jgi:hypothetical protein
MDNTQNLIPNKHIIQKFAEKWLASWSNTPEEVASFYSEDCFYRDPHLTSGIQGKTKLLSYLKKLLAKNPNWVWKVDDVFPIEGGFTLRWKASIPVGETCVETQGLDLVLLDKDGRISRNEVYFDRVPLWSAMKSKL